jgi:hypothetical protein
MGDLNRSLDTIVIYFNQPMKMTVIGSVEPCTLPSCNQITPKHTNIEYYLMIPSLDTEPGLDNSIQIGRSNNLRSQIRVLSETHATSVAQIPLLPPNQWPRMASIN